MPKIRRIADAPRANAELSKHCTEITLTSGGINFPNRKGLEPAWRTFGWCRGPESNWLRPPFQGGALPMSYPGIFELFNFRDDSEYCQFGALCTVQLQYQ